MIDSDTFDARVIPLYGLPSGSLQYTDIPRGQSATLDRRLSS